LVGAKSSSNIMGGLTCQDVIGGHIFNIGTGFTQAERIIMWQYKDRYINHTCTYKYQAYGVKNLPRSPVFKSIRKPE